MISSCIATAQGTATLQGGVIKAPVWRGGRLCAPSTPSYWGTRQTQSPRWPTCTYNTRQTLSWCATTGTAAEQLGISVRGGDMRSVRCECDVALRADDPAIGGDVRDAELVVDQKLLAVQRGVQHLSSRFSSCRTVRLLLACSWPEMTARAGEHMYQSQLYSSHRTLYSRRVSFV
jgi:hypothetical protein